MDHGVKDTFLLAICRFSAAVFLCHVLLSCSKDWRDIMAGIDYLDRAAWISVIRPPNQSVESVLIWAKSPLATFENPVTILAQVREKFP